MTDYCDNCGRKAPLTHDCPGRCGASKRNGSTCRAVPSVVGMRCHLHGGPLSPEAADRRAVELERRRKQIARSDRVNRSRYASLVQPVTGNELRSWVVRDFLALSVACDVLTKSATNA